MISHKIIVIQDNVLSTTLQLVGSSWVTWLPTCCSCRYGRSQMGCLIIWFLVYCFRVTHMELTEFGTLAFILFYFFLPKVRIIAIDRKNEYYIKMNQHLPEEEIDSNQQGRQNFHARSSPTFSHRILGYTVSHKSNAQYFS